MTDDTAEIRVMRSTFNGSIHVASGICSLFLTPEQARQLVDRLTTALEEE